MDEKDPKENEERMAIPTVNACSPKHALRTIRLLEKGARQAFLDGEVGLEDTKVILDRVKEAVQRCQAGDANACQVLEE